MTDAKAFVPGSTRSRRSTASARWAPRATAWPAPHAAHGGGVPRSHRRGRLVPRRRSGHRQARQPAPADPEDQGALPVRDRRERRSAPAGGQGRAARGIRQGARCRRRSRSTPARCTAGARPTPRSTTRSRPRRPGAAPWRCSSRRWAEAYSPSSLSPGWSCGRGPGAGQWYLRSALADRQVVDRGMAPAHEAAGVEFPVLVAVGAEPVVRVVVPLVGEAHGDAILAERPELLDEAVVELAAPFAAQELDDGGAAARRTPRGCATASPRCKRARRAAGRACSRRPPPCAPWLPRWRG